MATSRSKRTGKAPCMEQAMVPDDEQMVVNLLEKTKEDNSNKLEDRVVIAKIISQKNISKNGFKNSINSLWEELSEIQMTEVAPGIYAFTFSAKEHAADILENRPWFVLNSLLSIQPWSFNQSYMEVNFDLTPFWVQVHGLPLSLLSVEAIRTIGERVGRVLEIENPIVDGMVVRSFGRARLEINTAKPLWAGCWVTVEEDTKTWIGFKYEKLIGLCYGCGYLGHEQRLCRLPKMMSSMDRSKPKFGSFLTASTPKSIEWLVNENRFSGVRGSQKQTAMLNRTNRDKEQEEEVGESLASNNLNTESLAEGGLKDGTEQETGYNLRPRRRDQVKNYKEQQKLETGGKGDQIKEKEIIGTSYGLTKQVGYIERQTADDDPHQMVLFTKTLDGQNLEMRDLVEIDTAGGKWMEIGQDGYANELELGQDDQGQLVVAGREAGKLQEVVYTQVSNYPDNVYFIEFPEEKEMQQEDLGELKLDGATENELIGTWNERLSLKRDRRNGLGIEAVEEELLRRKKQKREAWYDEQGRILCVTISDEFGTTTMVRNEKGQLEPNRN